MQNKSRLALAMIAIMFVAAIFIGSRKTSGLRFDVKGTTAYVNGGTNSKSYGEMKAFLDENPQVDRLVLQYMPGTVDSMTNMRMSRLVRDRGLDTHLERRSMIASGAVDLFLSGVERTMDCGAMIGVHSWSIDGHIGPKDMGADYNQPVHEKYLLDMGIDPRFYVFTREAAEPESIYYMKEKEIRKFGLLTESAGCRP